MKKFFILLFIFLFLSLSLFSEDIVSGKRYSEKEVESFNELILVVNVPIKKSNLEIYKLQKTKESIFDNKLIVWKTEEGVFLDSIGVILYDNQLDYSTSVTNTSICFKIKMEDKNIHYLLYVGFEYENILLFPIQNNFIGDVCIGEKNIFYSTEMTENTIKKINITTGETFVYDGYYPNVDLFYIDSEENQEFGTIWFQYNKKNYIIEDDKIVLSNTVFPAQKKLSVSVFILNK